MANPRRFWIVCLLLLLVAFAFRFAVTRYIEVDDPDDSKVYAQIARNLLEQRGYSHSTGPPYAPSLVRVPGYPLFLAGVYWLFGQANDNAVRIAQALLDTATCGLLALLAFYWEPEGSRKRAAAIAALALAAVCPFSAIYTATILTETPTILLAVLTCLSAVYAFRAATFKRSIVLWSTTGVIAGIAVLFRPDSVLLAAAIAITLVGEITLGRNKEPADSEQRTGIRSRLPRAAALGAVFAAGCFLVLAPWTIRNERVFHLFQPLAPWHAKMPGEFVPNGYFAWLRTWIQDQRYIGPVLLKLGQAPIDVDEIPDTAFDSLEEKKQIEALFERYSHPPLAPTEQRPTPEFKPDVPEEGDSPSGNAAARPGEDEFELNEQENLPDEPEPNLNIERDQVEESQEVKMTPELDAAFAHIARERISRAPIRYYVSLPFRRAVSLWFDTHSQYYPFEGELMPLEELDKSSQQHIWLPLFAALTWIYTLLGVTGAWLLWRTQDYEGRWWVFLVGLIVFLRLGFFAALENPEPRYVVEIFPFLTILGGIAAGRIAGLRIRDWYKGRGVRVQ
ncbi:MAG TPA: glycosyltransferase family 39 protein [Pyrinomonadaceae bacterium]|nr:glycosyltransferase family 39 protein [Pyrinomonadaceae bacterium]